MKNLKKIIALIMAMAMVLAMAACGGSDEDSSETSESSTAVKLVDVALTEEEYAFGVNKNETDLLTQLNTFLATAKEDGTIDNILNNYFGDGTPAGVPMGTEDDSKDQLVIATNAEFAPFEYLDGETVYGVDMEIMKAFADSISKELVVVNMDFDSVLMYVDANKADIAAAGLTVNEAREQQVNFSDSYYNAAQYIIVKGDDTRFDGCTDKAAVENVLNGLDASVKIGCQNGTTGKSYVEGSEDFGFAGLPATASGFANGGLAVQAMLNGSIDMVIIDEAPAKSLVEKFNAAA